MRRRVAIVLVAVPLLLLAAACTSGTSCPSCQDVVTGIPWTAPESHTYELQQDGKDIGEFRLDIKQEGDTFVLSQLSHDDKGNSDESAVTVDAATLKPKSGTRTVIDSTQRRELETSYEPIEKECSSGEVVRITQRVYQPPADATPDSTRSNPMCVPEHAYDNDTSLFVWRTIKFEKGYTGRYQTVLANRRTTQVIELDVKDQVQVTVPAGQFDAWLVEITAQGSTQQAWYATSADHRLLKYNNDNLLFLLTE